MTVADLKKYKEILYGSFCRDMTEFEKNFLFVSGGILAFSTTFIKDIVKIESVTNLFILFAAWILIITAIGLMMITFLKSADASDKLWTTVDDFLMKNLYFDEKHELKRYEAGAIKSKIDCIYYQSKKLLRYLRITAVAIFLTGLLCLSTFVAINLMKEKNKSGTVSDIPKRVKGSNADSLAINN